MDGISQQTKMYTAGITSGGDAKCAAQKINLQELATLRVLSKTATARIYIGFDKHLVKNMHSP